VIKKYYIPLFIIFTVLWGTASIHAARVDAIHRHAVELGRKRMYPEALVEFERAISIHNRKAAQVYHNKAWSLEKTGDMKGAVENYARAIERNPLQVPTGERLGFLYYKTGDYTNAVKIGEHVLKIDSGNKKVPQWLPDAYLKKLQQEKLLADARKKKEEEERKKREEEKKRQQQKGEKERRIFLATFDFMIRTGLYTKGPNEGYKYIKDPGIIDIPERLYVSFTPLKEWQFDLLVENPWLGAMSPNLVIQNETIEAMYKLEHFMLGAGVFLNHYKGNIGFADENMTDIKVGFLFGYMKDNYEFKFTFYPRLIPHDGPSSTDETYDVDYVELGYKHIVSSALRYYTKMSARDYYIFDHTNKLSKYWGVYEIGLGVELGFLNADSDGVSIKFGIEYTQRFYTMDLGPTGVGNDDPYSIINGQGFLGMNKDKWFKGNPFSGLRGTSSELGFRVQEQFSKYFYLYQKFITELGEIDADDNHYEFNFLFGVGVTL